MICIILGTSEGRDILSELNKFTYDIFATTSTEYGGNLLKEFKYKVMNTSPLDRDSLKRVIIDNTIKAVVDLSHPYAVEITKNAQGVCEECNIPYIRYERPSIIDNYKNIPYVNLVKNYEELEYKLRNIEGTIFNTTGSKNIDKLMNMNIKNRIIHRVLPMTQVVKGCIDKGVRIEDIIAIKGPLSCQMNESFIKEYNAKAIIMKDSGIEGGTKYKLDAAINLKIQAFIIERQSNINIKGNVFNNIKNIVDYIKTLNSKEPIYTEKVDEANSNASIRIKL